MASWRDPIWKRPADVLIIEADFYQGGEGPLSEGSRLVTSNSRGVLAVRAEDADGNPVLDFVEDPPSIFVGAQSVVFVCKNGVLGTNGEPSTYVVELDAPTDTEEFLTDRFPIDVRRSYVE